MNLTKTLIAVIVTALLIVLLIIPIAAAQTPIIGDVDGDGNVTLVDATILQYGLAHMQESLSDYETVGDADADNRITIADVTLIQRYEAKLIPSLPFDPDAPATAPTTAPTAAPTVFPTDSQGWGQIIYRP